MPEFKFACPSCSQHLECDSLLAGQEFECPTCHTRSVLPPLMPAEVRPHSPPDDLTHPEGGAGTVAAELEPGSVNRGPLSGLQETGSFDLHTAPTEAELRAFVGKNADYYLEKWSAALVSKPQSAWAGSNWAAFLLPGFWLAYRKFYSAAALLWVAPLLVAVAVELLQSRKLTSTPMFGGLALPMWAALAASANQLYLAKARKSITRIRARRLRPQQHLAALAQSGGTSVAASVVFPLAGVAATFGVFVFLQYFGLASPYGKRLSFNTDELYYRPPVSEQQARKLGNYLVEARYFQGRHASVQLLQVGETMQFRMVVKEGSEQHTNIFEVVGIFGVQVSKAVFDGKPVRVDLCDRNFKTLVSVPPGG